MADFLVERPTSVRCDADPRGYPAEKTDDPCSGDDRIPLQKSMDKTAGHRALPSGSRGQSISRPVLYSDKNVMFSFHQGPKSNAICITKSVEKDSGIFPVVVQPSDESMLLVPA